MASSRAEEVAEVLWELKRAGKMATFTVIARRAGFSAGSNGRSVTTALKTVRRDWSHLQWWRAIKDDGLLEKDCEQVCLLTENGFEVEEADPKKNLVTIKGLEQFLMIWDEQSAVVAAVGASQDESEE